MIPHLRVIAATFSSDFLSRLARSDAFQNQSCSTPSPEQ
jgi:hypothetical protein